MYLQAASHNESIKYFGVPHTNIIMEKLWLNGKVHVLTQTIPDPISSISGTEFLLEILKNLHYIQSDGLICKTSF